MATAVEMRDIVRQFPGVLANDHVCLEIQKGEIHGLLGENGAVLPVVAYLFITAVIVERGRTFEDI